MENEGKNVFNNSILVIPFHIFTILEKSHFYHLKITHAVYMQYTCSKHVLTTRMRTTVRIHIDLFF